MNRLLKQSVRVALHGLGGLKPVLWYTRKNLRILTYHRFSEDRYPGGKASLRSQCAFLKRNFEVIPLSVVGECLRAGKPLPDRALVVTIDDGYRDILLDAQPIFKDVGIPATVFLITDFLDRKLWPWWNQVEYAVMHSQRPSVEIVLSGQEVQMPLQTAEQRAHASAFIADRLVKVSNGSRLAFMRALPELFAIDLPRQAPPEYAPLSWDEVRLLARSGLEFGAHTRTHPILTSIEDPEELKEEIFGSKARIDQELARPAPHFCYPNGDWNDGIVNLLKQAGFELAVTTQGGMNKLGEDPYRLKRFSVEPGLPDDYFREEVASLH